MQNFKGVVVVVEAEPRQKQDDEEDAETLRDDGPKSCFLP